MSYLNDTVPADVEAQKIGARRIRELKTALNSLVSQIWNDAGEFLSKWLTRDQIADAAIGADQIDTGAVTLSKLPAGVLSADDSGRAKMADGFLTSAKAASGFRVPNGSIDVNALAAGALTADATGRAKMADGFLTLAKVGFSLSQIAIGTYTGSNSASQNINTLSFQPDVIIFFGGTGLNKVGIALRVEASGGNSSIHSTWQSAGITGAAVGAVQWQSNGFIVTPSNFDFNVAGQTHSYIALKA